MGDVNIRAVGGHLQAVTGVARLRIHPALASKLVTVAGVCRRRGGQARLDVVLAHLVVGLDDLSVAGLTVTIAIVSSPAPPGAPATAARPRWFILPALPASRRPTPGGLRLGPGLRSLTVWPRSGLGEDGRKAPPRRGGSCSTVFAHQAFCRSSSDQGGLMPSPMPTITLPSSDVIPVLGQGTWHLAEVAARRDEEILALRRGLDLGMTVIDTAEMYAEGEAEKLVGEAIADRRDEVFLVQGAAAPRHGRGTVAACEASLRRLGTDRIDLYLLHWRGRVPLADTDRGVRRPAAGRADQVLGGQQLRRAGHEGADRPARRPGGRDRSGPVQPQPPRARAQPVPAASGELRVPIMAYSPIEQGRILGHPVLREIAELHHATPAQIALAWVLRRDDVCAIPRAPGWSTPTRTAPRPTSSWTRPTWPSSTRSSRGLSPARWRCSDGQNFPNGLYGSAPATGSHRIPTTGEPCPAPGSAGAVLRRQVTAALVVP